MKIIKNTTANAIYIKDTGTLLPANSSNTIHPQNYDLWAASIEIDTHINNGNIIINDGYDDLKIDIAKIHIHDESVPRQSAYQATALVLACTNSTLTLTSSSRLLYVFNDGVAGQIVKLPDARTLNVGYKYEVWNISPNSIQINDANNTPQFVIAVAQKTWMVLVDNTSLAGQWIFEANYMGGTGGGNGCLNFGYNGSAATNRYLEVIGNNPSNATPFIIAGTKSIRALSCACDTNATATISLYKNGSIIDSISLSSSKKNTKLNLNHLLLDKDELVARVTSGTLSRPILTIWL